MNHRCPQRRRFLWPQSSFARREEPVSRASDTCVNMCERHFRVESHGFREVMTRRAGPVMRSEPAAASTWDWFCLDGVPYHGRSLTIPYDRTGGKYNRGTGLFILADGKLIAQPATLGRLTAE
jgi:hypothetical protein